MPIYEFRCRACGKRVSVLVGMTADSDSPRCEKCGSQDLDKLVSRFRRGRTEDDRLDEAAEIMERRGEPETTAEMRSMVRDLGRAMDDDMADEMEEMLESDLEGNGTDEI